MDESEFIDVPIKASYVLAALLVGAHVAAMAAVIVLPVPWWARLAGSVLLLASACLMVRRYALLKGAQACTRLRMSENGACDLQIGNGCIVKGRLRSGWFASPLLIAAQVRCKDEWLPRNIPLLPDSSDAETLRRLRIFLRFALGRSAPSNRTLSRK